MRNVLYAANLAESVTEEQLLAVFQEYGDVESVEFATDEPSNTRYALVVMSAEKQATKARNSMNGIIVEGQRLAVTPTEADIRDRLSSKQQKVYDRVISTLGESDKIPLRQVEAMTMLCGTNFVEALLEETEEVEQSEGIPTSDGSRKRTKGGVFFYLARYRMPRPIRSIVYNRKGKLPVQTEETGETEDTD